MKKSLTSNNSSKRNKSKRRSGAMRGEIFKTLVIVGLAGLLAFVMVYAYNFALCADYFQLKHTTVRGCKRISEEEIKGLAGISFPLNILTANLEKMERGVEENPWVRNASVGREFPDRLVIEVTERASAALLKKEGDLYVVDRDGVVFKKFEAGDSADVPVFTGFYQNGELQRNLLEKTFEFLDYLSKSDHFPRVWNVSEIYVDDVYDFSVVTDNHLFLNLGFEDYEKKLKRLKKVMADLARRNLDGRTLTIDLVDPSRVVVRQGNIFNRKGPTGNRKMKI